MCGIFGYCGVASSDRHKLLHRLVSELARQSETRGTHSTGFSARFDSGHIVSDKLPYRGGAFCRISSKFRALARNMPSTFIGHTRYGTGSNPKINNNNHPFFGKDFNMVHNGSIPGWRDIGRTNNVLDRMTSETDSEVVLRVLESKMEEDGGRFSRKHIEWILSNVYGKMAIALLDKSSPNLYLFRNEKPLHVFTVSKTVFGNQIYFFCSTQEIFKEAFVRIFGTKMYHRHTSSQYLDADQLFRLSNVPELIDGKPERFIIYKLNVTRPFRQNYSYAAYRGFGGSGTARTTTTKIRKEFFSRVVNLQKPELGMKLSPHDIKQVKSDVVDSNKEVYIDGMHVSSYIAMGTLSRALLGIFGEKPAPTAVSTFDVL